MKYLKLFEDIENDLWEEISFHDFENHEVIKLPERIQKEIISLFKRELNQGWSITAGEEYHFFIKIDSDLCPSQPNHHHFSLHNSYDWTLTFELCDDYWYLVSLDDGNGETHYKCDDIIGIKKLLQHLKIFK